MAGSAAETLFWLLACAFFFLTCVSIIVSIAAALWAVSNDKPVSISRQERFTSDPNSQPKDRPRRVVRYCRLIGVPGLGHEKAASRCGGMNTDCEPRTTEPPEAA
jgi:hypothetical protein